MAGYSALPSLDIDPIGIGAAHAASMQSTFDAQQLNQQRAQMFPADLQAKQLENDKNSQLNPLEIQSAKNKSALEAMSMANDTLGQVAKDAQAADPEEAPDVWDEGMRAAADKGVAQAKQYIGHYRPDLAERVGDVYGNGQEGGRASKSAAASGPAYDPVALNRAVAQMPLPDVTKGLANLNRTISSFNTVKDKQSWDNEIQMLKENGIAVDKFLPNLDYNPLNYAAASRIIQGLIPMRDAMANRAATAAMGGPNVQPAPMYEPNFQYVGTDPSGKPIYHDTRSNMETTGQAPIGAKPSVTMNNFAMKQQAWLGVHPGDNAGALDFANGKRNLSPAQMQDMALAQANKELGNMILNGSAPQDVDAWVKMKASENYKMISGAASPANGQRPSGPAASQLPTRALDALRKAGGKPVRFNNGMVYKMGPNGQPVRVQ